MENNYKAILIGGASGTGKSYIARELGKQLGLPVLEVDDVRITMQQIADRDKYKDLFVFLKNPNYLDEMTVENFVTAQVNLNKVVWQSLKVLISKHIYLNETVIIEGDGLLPELINLDFKEGKDIKCIFLKADEDTIKTNKQNRNRHGLETSKIGKEVELNFAYNNHLLNEAKKFNYEIIDAKPQVNIIDRLLKII